MSAHQVKRARFRVKAPQVPDQQQRQQWQQQFETRYLPLLDQALEAWLQRHPQLQGRMLQVGRLQIALGKLDTALNDDALLLSLQRQLDEQLPQVPTLSPDSWQLQCYLQFLRAGTWPAGSTVTTIREMEPWWRQHQHLLPRLRGHLRHWRDQETPWVRLCLQHSADFLIWLAGQAGGQAPAPTVADTGPDSALQATLQLWTSLCDPSAPPLAPDTLTVLRAQLRAAMGLTTDQLSPAVLLRHFIRTRSTSVDTARADSNVVTAPDAEDASIRRTLEQEAQPTDAPAGSAVQQAGLVLLHPWLPQLFTGLGLLRNGDFVDDDCRLQALFVLHFAGTGLRSADEGELTLHKFLVHWPANQVVPASVSLPEAHYAQTEELLRAVIAHWTVLKNTSIEGLRESFLARAGILRSESSMHELVVASSAIDLLLDQLPWSISVVKLPWLAAPLHVSWRR